MTDPGAYVEQARIWASRLTARENTGSGDLLSAMRRLARQIGLSWWDLWSLHYRPPKRIFADVYLTLKHAYEAECERQKKLGDEAKERVLRSWEQYEEKQHRNACSCGEITAPGGVASSGDHPSGARRSSTEIDQDVGYASEPEDQGVP